ncbi:aldehyde dehydrogenase family protein [Herbiconiux sp. CPCC 203407]|uniref:Aldehyde dehydrogenase family protein n=1 Tax=Herbiconiux oxytropis TaxID=2970915 RepID=A0AA41XH10_9MICO|nr:aldehyde dehydrogenase family protein [Herbiconiux oxytropis]MCS5723960.1 aldehyde dehydrogenase family protein [Herbiconiux oxytropis]MCS5728034.1 aldehyde dehydrogenase family protein [Herbiconiux oxytropis]
MSLAVRQDESAAASPAAEASYDPATGEIRGSVAHTPAARVDALLEAAALAAPALASSSPAERSVWIEAASAAVLEHTDELVAIAEEETRLGLPRLTGELERAAAQARFYAGVALEGSYLDVCLDEAPAGSLARWNVPLGPVAVFGASNFPFGFGVFGHDVASALAAGCPVVVKAHPAHPRLSAAIAEVVGTALSAAGAPEGAHALVVGFDAGLQIVDDPRIAVVCFTGSQAGGMALVERAARRGVPVFAEMGTVNPVFVSPAAEGRRDEIAAGFVGSYTLGAGQFCTKPGLLLAPAGQGYAAAIRSVLDGVAPAPLLTEAIAARFSETAARLQATVGADVPVAEPPSGFTVAPALVTARISDLTEGSPLLEECFGPVAVVAEYESVDEALEALARLQPSLAASVFTSGDPERDDPGAASAVRSLIPRVGRVAVDAWPTGVIGTWAQQHGGPWPATSRPEATSVGAGALDRFLRPVTVQNARAGLIPAFVSRENPWSIPLRIDGRLHLPHPASALETETTP